MFGSNYFGACLVEVAMNGSSEEGVRILKKRIIIDLDTFDTQKWCEMHPRQNHDGVCSPGWVSMQEKSLLSLESKSKGTSPCIIFLCSDV